ncbi:MAG: M23 family metallopeptidase, partial [Actinomycetota bacterium]
RGTVSFAGPVAHDGLFVTIDHANGLQTTYSFLSLVVVSAGQVVRRGDRIANSGNGHPGGPPLLHFGAKRNGSYIDPEPLLSDGDDISRYLSLAPMDQRDWENGDHYSSESHYIAPGQIGRRDGPSAGSIDPVRPAGGSDSNMLRNGSGSRFSEARKIRESQLSKSRQPRGARIKSAEQARRSKIQTIELRKSHKDAVGGRSQRSGPGKARTNEKEPWYRSAGRAMSRVFGNGVEAISAVGPLSVRAFKKVRLFSIRGFDRITDAAAGLFTEARLVIGSGLDGLGSAIQKLPRWVIPGPEILPKKFGLGMAGGAVRQAGCFFKGGSALPDLPTSEELNKGAKPPPPPNDNIVIAVAGIGSSSHEGSDGTIKSSASMYKMD